MGGEFDKLCIIDESSSNLLNPTTPFAIFPPSLAVGVHFPNLSP